MSFFIFKKNNQTQKLKAPGSYSIINKISVGFLDGNVLRICELPKRSNSYGIRIIVVTSF
jgi:hypothetical protein